MNNKLFLIYILLILSVSTSADSKELKIVTANLLFNNYQSTKVTSELINLNPDIIILIEWTGKNTDIDIFEKKGYLFVTENKKNDPSGITILAKEYLNANGSIIDSPVKGSCQMPLAIISFKINNKKISILGVHIPPPVSHCKKLTKPVIKSIQEWITNGKLNTKIGTGDAGDILIIGGDFNSFPNDEVMKKFKKIGMIDTVTKSNDLFNPTWSPFNSNTKLIRIDYIFSSKHLIINKSKTFLITGSDHKGILAELIINDK